MKKDTAAGKKTAAQEDGFKPVSDEALECAAGGSGTFHTRWVCKDCGFHGDWDIGGKIIAYQQDFHYRQTGHYQFAIETVNLSGPNEPLPD